ncbi:XkdX family protein [Desertibacillus haloalkaliphilus]|nr:XkdX family protein [Desertibacillus haloalkaliphilus]MBU8908485.1 XkdX family protein [Desertibacillus haloalkaliphilus]
MWFDRIKRFYDRELWTLEQVKDGVRTNHITEEEYEEITGESFED